MKARILVYGYGNAGRLDDGLGPALVAALGERALEGVDLETAYQLQVEDAALLAGYDVVVFADAHATCAPPFELRELEPRASTAFSTHSVAPEAVLALAHEHFGARTTGYVLGIRGFEFDEFGERLSERARAGLDAAVDHLEGWLRARLTPEEDASSKLERETA